MKKTGNREIHSPEVRDILEKKPSWIIRWGTLVITVVVVISILVWWKLFS